MEHLALEVFGLGDSTASQYAVLEPDATITITDTSEIFADGDVWSYDFTLNVPANAHLFGTAGDIHGSRLHEQIDKRKARLWVEGVPLHLGYLKLGSEADVDAKGNVDVSFESGQKTFDEMIEGAKANQVPMMNDVLIGMALWRKRWTKFSVRLTASLTYKTEDYDIPFSGNVKHDGNIWFDFAYDGEEDGNSVQEYPRMVFPKGHFESRKPGTAAWEENLVNTDHPYTEDEHGTPTHQYCNIALCYQKYDYMKKDEKGVVKPDYSAEPEAQRGYEYMPANRVNSAPNFYVIYWLRCLMKHLGIYVEENQMMDVEDLRRLFFVNSRCEYDEPEKLRTANYSERYGCYRGNGIVPEYIDAKKNVNIEESSFTISSLVSKIKGTPEAAVVKVREVKEWDPEQKEKYKEKNDYFHLAYAKSDCFPNADVSEVISAIENGFGVRLLFSNDYKRVRIVLLRNVFRSEEVQDIACEIVKEDVKVENNIRGFRMTYGNTEDTHFYYKGFADKLPHKKEMWVDDSDKHDYSKWNLNASYANIVHKVSAFDKTCYVTANNGNSYIIKVDKDAKRYDDLHPSLFEGAGFMDAEDGDCTGEEETIKTINLNFVPAIVNDLNFEDERDGKTDKPRYALFVDETMRVRRIDFDDGKDYNAPDTVYDVDNKLYAKNGDNYVYFQKMHGDSIVAPGEFAIRSDMYARANNVTAELYTYMLPAGEARFNIDGHINEGYRLYLQDNFEPNDTGVSPIETHDWGLTLGIMRGSGSDAYVNEYDDPDDDENNAWEIVSGSSVTAHPDTCDSYGNEWDYNGNQPGISSATIISTPAQAIAKLVELWPNSHASFYDNSKGFLTYAYGELVLSSDDGKYHHALFATSYSNSGQVSWTDFYVYFNRLQGKSIADIMAADAEGYNGLRNLIIELDGNASRASTLMSLCRIAYGGSTETLYLNNDGEDSRYGRLSLKLRAEKPNPYFNPLLPESDSNRRYLQITNKYLQGRGLADQFYKEYSYWIRNARIVKRTVRMTLAQLLTIDKTKHVRVGDVTGFIRKMQYTVSNETGLGNVVLEIMYI